MDNGKSSDGSSIKSNLFSLQKAMQVFGASLSEKSLSAQVGAFLPNFAKHKGRQLKSWSTQEIGRVGARIGFLQTPKSPQVVSVFVTKGGVLKTSLSLNIARLAAMHGMRVCVIGLDMQADVTHGLGFASGVEDAKDLQEALSRLNAVQGLAQVFSGEKKLTEVLAPTDLPNLFLIPETAELVGLDQLLGSRNRREYWLKEKVIDPLKKDFDLIILDCPPNWNHLITNALVACDVLLSPLECKINNFRNLSIFRALLAEFRRDMHLNFDHIYIPSRLSTTRKLSKEIYDWYIENLNNCTKIPMRESLVGEEASALHISIPEHQPSSPAADEMRLLLQNIWKSFPLKAKSQWPGQEKSERASRNQKEMEN